MGQWWCAAAWLLVACGGRTAPPPEPTVAPPAEVAPVSASPEGLYAECRDRVEGPEAAGECAADADCGRTGCGSEVCTTSAEVANVMTTCEDRPCFAVLDTCGCHDGRCTWTVRPAGPAAPR
jgi:eight-cysteine-cluster-containing protein